MAGPMDSGRAQAETEKIINVLCAINTLTEDILMDKREIVDLDMKKNKCREAHRHLKEHNSGSKTWICFGNTFIKTDTRKCLEMLEEDQKSIDKEINNLRDSLKPKVADLHKMEGRPEVKGFQLSGIKKEDLVFVN